MKTTHALEHFSFPIPVTQESLNEAYALGMLKKSELVDGKEYCGTCRNASKAVWHADKNCFTYTRHKFGASFDEDINHPEDDDGYDLFIAFGEQA